MKRFSTWVFAFVAILVTSVYASEEIYYILKPNFQVQIINLYEMTEQTKVKRVISENDTMTYERDITYHISLYPPAEPNDGFQDVDVSIDSINYRFTDGKISKVYNTMDFTPSPLSFQDYEMIGPTISQKYTMTYSPYGEVSKISGESLEKAIKMLDHKTFGISDPVKRQIWQNAYSFDHLTFLADVTKNYFPLGKIGRDSVWKKEVTLDLNRVYFKDTVYAKIDDIKSSKYQLRGTLDSLVPISSLSMLYDIKKPVKIKKATGNGILDVEFTPAGVVEFVSGDFITEITYQHNGKEIKEIAETKLSWELVRRLSY